jgi:hypothetical protein
MDKEEPTGTHTKKASFLHDPQGRDKLTVLAIFAVGFLLIGFGVPLYILVPSILFLGYIAVRILIRFVGAIHNPSKKRRTAVIAMFVIFLLIDFVPYPGPANFEYPGSDPYWTVLNYGFPVSFLIYDMDKTHIVHPSIELFLALYAVQLFALILVYLLLRPPLQEPDESE